jgi:hypothetical protein
MKYMLMFWEDESAEVTPEEGAATLTAIRSWVDEMTGRGIRLHGSELEPVAPGGLGGRQPGRDHRAAVTIHPGV